MANEQLTRNNKKTLNAKADHFNQKKKEEKKKITEKLAIHKRNYIACDILEILILKKYLQQTCECFSRGGGR